LPQAREMQDAQGPGNAGTDQWNIGIGHSMALVLPP
jgi:hypothetical protein